MLSSAFSLEKYSTFQLYHSNSTLSYSLLLISLKFWTYYLQLDYNLFSLVYPVTLGRQETVDNLAFNFIYFHIMTCLDMDRLYRLAWNESQYGRIESIRVPLEKIWKPDVVFYNRFTMLLCTTKHCQMFP